MTTELTAEQRARLAKLGQRNRATSLSVEAIAPAPTPWSPPAGPPVTVGQIVFEPATAATISVDRHTSVRLFGSRRRHVAAAGRILATGLATSGFLATIASLAIADARTAEANQADAATPPTTEETVHRVVYVDESGNPTAPPTTVAQVVTSPATTIATALESPTTTMGTAAPVASTPTTTAAPATPVPAAAPKPAAAPAAEAAPEPTPAPAVEPAPTVAPAPTAAPVPTPAPAPTPAPTPAPELPPTTTPTTAPAPAPAPPPCQGSGC